MDERLNNNMSGALVPPYFLADHTALDFINTLIGVEPNRIEIFSDDVQVLEWLNRAGLPAVLAKPPPPGQRGALLSAALDLRETALDLLTRRKTETTGNPSALNAILALGSTYQELIWKKGWKPESVQRRRVAKIQSLLVPVAEAIAELLSDGDFSLVRQCEGPGCTMWFYDRTKSHHRRWCSAAMCGNRMKVAAFRARQKAR